MLRYILSADWKIKGFSVASHLLFSAFRIMGPKSLSSVLQTSHQLFFPYLFAELHLLVLLLCIVKYRGFQLSCVL